MSIIKKKIVFLSKSEKMFYDKIIAKESNLDKLISSGELKHYLKIFSIKFNIDVLSGMGDQLRRNAHTYSVELYPTLEYEEI